MATFNLSGRDRHDKVFGLHLMDPLAGGFGAFADHDGQNAAGPINAPCPSIADVEVNEQKNPLFYHYRRLAPGHRRCRPSTRGGSRRGGRSHGLRPAGRSTRHDPRSRSAELGRHRRGTARWAHPPTLHRSRRSNEESRAEARFFPDHSRRPVRGHLARRRRPRRSARPRPPPRYSPTSATESSGPSPRSKPTVWCSTSRVRSMRPPPRWRDAVSVRRDSASILRPERSAPPVTDDPVAGDIKLSDRLVARAVRQGSGRCALSTVRCSPVVPPAGARVHTGSRRHCLRRRGGTSCMPIWR